MTDSASTPPAACPVCNSRSHIAKHLPASHISTTLERYTESRVPDDVCIQDYILFRCSGCDLEFSSPPHPADDAFYTWLDQQNDYYTSERWEWGQVVKQIQAHMDAHGQCSVLELGAGAGYFLKHVRDTTGARVVAVERSEEPAKVLTDQGIETYTPEQAAAAVDGLHFDFVVAFHCLEHIPNPLAFVQGMCQSAGTAGRVFVSIPYSPMFYESRWYDPLNHPPHHMTRWNKRALAKLAECVGGHVKLSSPPAFSLLARARMALCIVHQGPRWYHHRRRALLVPFRHPLSYIAEVLHQRQRDRINGEPASDVVLAEILR